MHTILRVCCLRCLITQSKAEVGEEGIQRLETDGGKQSAGITSDKTEECDAVGTRYPTSFFARPAKCMVNIED